MECFGVVDGLKIASKKVAARPLFCWTVSRSFLAGSPCEKHSAVAARFVRLQTIFIEVNQ
jgi:hypothetical protein